MSSVRRRLKIKAQRKASLSPGAREKRLGDFRHE
jgi:hypothetical protein